MAKSNSEISKARILSDAGHLRAGDVAIGTEAEIKALVAAGVADDHPDAVAYASAQDGAREVPATAPVEVDDAATEEAKG